MPGIKYDALFSDLSLVVEEESSIQLPDFVLGTRSVEDIEMPAVYQRENIDSFQLCWILLS